MAQVNTKYIPFMVYEHKKSNGDLVTKTEISKKRGNKYLLILKDGNNKTLSETTNTIDGLTLEEKTFDTKGKVVTQFNFEYDEKGVLMKIVDKDGVTSLTEEFLAKEGAIIE